MGSFYGRMNELDALRGIAALAVVLYHYTTRYNEIFDSKQSHYLDFKYGYLGVELFFIISGFVIFMTILKIKSIKDFLIKRSIRLYPAYVISVLLTFTLVSLYGLKGREVTTIEALFNLTMLQGFFPGFIKHVDGAYWSLTVELIFYFIMSTFLYFNIRKNFNKIVLLWLGVAFFFNGLSLFFDNMILTAILYFGIFKYCHLFIAGVLFYKIRTGHENKYHLLLLICLFYSFLFDGEHQFIAICAFFLLFYLLIYGKLNFLNRKVLTFLGSISYSLYLIHQNLGYIIMNFLNEKGFTNELFILIPIFLSILIATCITFFVEKPIQNLLNKNKNISRPADKLAQ